MAEALKNPRSLRYKQGLIDALRAVARVEDGSIAPEVLQQLLDDLPNTWDQSLESAYVTGFEDMYGVLVETLAFEYAPEAAAASREASEVENDGENTPNQPNLLREGPASA